ncbi:MAG: class I SAM-dependent methyltransferase [Janthinobacterium lividum]
MEISRDDVIAAYRFFLEREPESKDAIDAWLRPTTSRAELREGFLHSDEYQSKNFVLHPSLSGMEPPIVSQIDSDLNDAQNRTLFSAVKETWTHLGDVDPYWAVLSMDEFHGADDGETIERFYRSGAGDVQFIERTLERNGVMLPAQATVVEYGSGLGRVTSHLAQRFATVIGVDISPTMVRAATARMAEKRLANVSFRLLEAFDDIDSLPACDLFFSLIVLQHSPPPLISKAVRSAIRALKPEGVAIFQVPTYIPEYKFLADDYISGKNIASFEAPHHLFEMHAVRQCDLFGIIYGAGGMVLEIFEDKRMGVDYQGAMSNTFVVRKR